MGVGIGVLLTIVVILVIAWPFLRSGRDPKLGKGNLSEAARLREAKENVYQQIRQLQQDHRAALISDTEYQNHLRELRVEAAELMRAQERAGAEVSPEDELELEIRAIRSSQRADESPETR